MMRPKKLPRDINQRAHKVATLLTRGTASDEVRTERSEHMARIGRLGGKSGGKIRAERLSPQRRKEIAKNAANQRWKSR
jgi:hypothetical protein